MRHLESAEEKLRAEKERLKQQAGALVYASAEAQGVAPFEEARKQALSAHLLQAFGRDHSHDIQHHAEDINHWLAALCRDLRDDLQAALGADGATVLRRTAIDFMPHLRTDAFVEGWGEGPEAAWMVGINVGLVWLANLVAEALLRASQGDDVGAQQAYAAAQAAFTAQSRRELDRAWQSGRDLSDEVALQAGAVGAVVLRFVALHEMGHVVLGHVGRWEMGVREDSGIRRYAALVADDTLATQAMETEADLFALECMIRVSQGPHTMWNNLLFIGAYFRLLAQVEARQGHPLCPYHPPAARRMDNLYQHLVARMGPPPNDAWLWAQSIQEEMGAA